MESLEQSLYHYSELDKHRKFSSPVNGAVFTLVPVCKDMISNSEALQIAKRLYGHKKDIAKLTPEARFKVVPITAFSNVWHYFKNSGQFMGTQHSPEKTDEGDYPVMSIQEVTKAIASKEVCPKSYFLVGTEAKFPLEMVSVERAK